MKTVQLSDRLTELRTKLAKQFGKTTMWRWLCKQRNAESEEEQIAIAEETLAGPPIGVAAYASTCAKLDGAIPIPAPPYKVNNPEGN